ncbi:CST complex subunit TEN1-like isoform X2 [Antedon mediterranea]|uniref:CST complex subunit TEN1-like isoform X2 n=1 Tax=Antedon mediterranea TaxID=105859 RepID=UPI003AF7A855
MSSFASLPPPGCIKTVKEICNERVPKTAKVIGRLIERDIKLEKGVLSSRDKRHSLTINTRLIEPFQAKINCLYQVIGEVDVSRDQQEVIMTVRTAMEDF